MQLLFALSRDLLKHHERIVKTGTIVDATIISAPTSMKNKANKRDGEMKSTKSGNTCHFGIKAQISTDTHSLLHRVSVTPTNEHDAIMMEACLHGEEEVIYGDTACVSEQRMAEAEANGMEWRVEGPNNAHAHLCEPVLQQEKQQNPVQGWTHLRSDQASLGLSQDPLLRLEEDLGLHAGDIGQFLHGP